MSARSGPAVAARALGFAAATVGLGPGVEKGKTDGISSVKRLLSSGPARSTVFSMSIRLGCSWALCLWTMGAAGADLVQLKDGAAVSGKLLVDKPDYVVLDLGFTALTIPRVQIVKVTSEADGKSGGPVTPITTESIAQTYFTAKTPPPERAVRDWAKELGEAVVQVRTPGGLGSGFFINEEGYLITNFHVIEGETQISVEVYHQSGGRPLERRPYKKVKIVALNKFHDLALLRIEEDGESKMRFKRVLIGGSDALSQGERVFAIGSPLGLERTVTEGIVSVKAREVQGELFLQTTTQINPGNSGGPLFNLRGEVIGVNNMKISAGEGLAFAIPSERLKYFLEHRDAFSYDNDNPSNPYRYLEPPRVPVAPGKKPDAKKDKAG